MTKENNILYNSLLDKSEAGETPEKEVAGARDGFKPLKIAVGLSG